MRVLIIVPNGSIGLGGFIAAGTTLCYALSDGLSCRGQCAIVRELMCDVDRTLLHENLKLSFEERAQKHLRVLQMVEELRRAGKKLRQKSNGR
jgi:adenylylsulfate kinase-like enzyme